MAAEAMLASAGAAVEGVAAMKAETGAAVSSHMAAPEGVATTGAAATGAAAMGAASREHNSHGSRSHKRSSHRSSSRNAIVMRAAAVGAVARRTVIRKNPITEYNHYSLQFTSNKIYELLVTISNSIEQDCDVYFENKCTKPSHYMSHCYWQSCESGRQTFSSISGPRYS